MNILARLKIRTQMFLLALTTISMVVCIMLYAYVRFERIFTEKNDNYTEQVMSQIKQSIITDYNSIKRIVYNIGYNKDVQLYLIENRPVEKQMLYERARDTIANIKNLRDGIVDIVIVDNSKHILELANGSEYMGVLDKAAYKEREIYFSGMIKYDYLGYSKNCFIVRMDIYSVIQGSSTNEKIGLLLLFIDTRSISGNIGNLYGSTETAINLIDRNGYVFAGNEKQNVGRSLGDLELPNKNGKIHGAENRKDIIVSNQNIPGIGGSIVCVIPRKELLYDISEIRKLELIFFLITIMLLAIPFSLILRNILNPINSLLSYIYEVKSGNLKNLKKRVLVKGHTEMSVMTHEFNGMMEEINNLTKRLLDTSTRLYKSELQKKNSELAYLRSQINPHFLYNTLESIKGIAMEEGVPKIVDITKALARVFKYSVKGADIVSLKEELDIVKAYIDIQLVRFGNRFDVSYEFTEDLLEYRVPKMILQPVVENSIIHGLEPKKDNGLLQLGGRIDENKSLILWVKDNGIGIEQETLAEIGDSMTEDEATLMGQTDSQRSIGLTNVNSRIKLMHGAEYGINIQSVKGEGTEVEIKMPVEGGDIDVQSDSGR